MAKKDRQQGQPKGESDIDFGFGKLSLGGIFKGMGNLFDLAKELAEKGEELRKEGTFTAGKTKSGQPIQGVYGFSIRTMAGGKPFVETFGNIKTTPKGPVVDETREPLVDVFNESEEIVVVAELPGVDEGSIETQISHDILTLKAQGQTRKYQKEILLPCPVKSDSMTKSFKNGILEIRFKK